MPPWRISTIPTFLASEENAKVMGCNVCSDMRIDGWRFTMPSYGDDEDPVVDNLSG